MASALRAYHRDSWLKELTTRVVSCRPTKKGDIVEVETADTVLFPEGGGQPDDHGTLGGFPVVRVRRKGDQVIHEVQVPSADALGPGAEIDLKVDWPRRFFHMQQHSGQHLVSAVAFRDFGFATHSWSLRPDISYIDFSTEDMSAQQLAAIEATANEAIRQRIPVEAVVADRDSDIFAEAKTRGLPDDVSGPIRVIRIAGIDNNMCCGTHVSNLADLQLVKLLRSEKVKKTTRVHFVAGLRALEYFGELATQDHKMTGLLSSRSDMHLDKVEKMLADTKMLTRSKKQLLREVAGLQVESIKNTPDCKVACVHHSLGDMDYLNFLCSCLADTDILLLASIGTAKDGMVVLRGPEALVATHASEVAKLLDAKGGGRKDKWQGKAANLGAGRPQAIAHLQDALGVSVLQLQDFKDKMPS